MEFEHVSEASFQIDVLDATQPVLVDFTATWCHPCKMLEPEVKKLAQDWGAKVKVVKLDIDSNPDLTMQYQVMGVPTLMLFVHGEPVERASGFQPKDRLAQRFNPHLR